MTDLELRTMLGAIHRLRDLEAALKVALDSWWGDDSWCPCCGPDVKVPPHQKGCKWAKAADVLEGRQHER